MGLEKKDFLFLKIVSAVIHSESADYSAEDPQIIEAAIDLSLANGTAGLVYYGLEKSREKLPENISDKLIRIRNITIMQAFASEPKLEPLKELIEAIKKEKLDYLVLKGLSLKKLYPLPELRNMQDVDIFFPGRNHALADGVFKALGYSKVSGYEEDEYHTAYSKPGCYMIESHYNLGSFGYLGASSVKSWENGLIDSAVTERYQNISYKLMDDDDFFVHLLIHHMNHLLSRCSNLRDRKSTRLNSSHT